MSSPCNNPCQVIICAVPNDLVKYTPSPPEPSSTLPGPPPEPLPPILPTLWPSPTLGTPPSAPLPPILIFNQQVFVEGFCSGGRAPYYSGSLPSWITLDIANNRIVGQAGTYSGQDQSAANVTAQAALVLAAQQLGITCVWYNQPYSLICGADTIAIPVNAYHSTVSQVDADSQASAAAAAACVTVPVLPDLTALTWIITPSTHPTINYLTVSGASVYFNSNVYATTTPLQSSAVAQFNNTTAAPVTIRASWVLPCSTNPIWSTLSDGYHSYNKVSVNGTYLLEVLTNADGGTIVNPCVVGVSAYADIIVPANTVQTITVLNQSKYYGHASGTMIFTILP